MSESTPRPPDNNSRPGNHNNQQNNRQNSRNAGLPPLFETVPYTTQRDARPLGWSLSVGLHILACSALLLTGLYGSQRLKQPPGSLSPVAAADPASAQARRQVQQLLQAHKELEQVQAQTEADYERWLPAQTRHAVANVQRSVQAAGQAHQAAAQALQRIAKAQQALQQARQTLSQTTDVIARRHAVGQLQKAEMAEAASQDTTQRAQARAGEAYADASRNLAFAPSESGNTQPVQQAIATAATVQAQARDAQNHAASMLSALAITGTGSCCKFPGDGQESAAAGRSAKCDDTPPAEGSAG